MIWIYTIQNMLQKFTYFIWKMWVGLKQEDVWNQNCVEFRIVMESFLIALVMQWKLF